MQKLLIKPFEIKVKPTDGGEIIYRVKAPKGGWNLKPQDVFMFERSKDPRTGADVDKLHLHPDDRPDITIELTLDRKGALKTDQLTNDDIADILNEGGRWWE
jgi:hypothetical protein